VRDSRGAVGPPSKKEQIRRIMSEQPSPVRTAKLRKAGFVPKGKSPGRTEVRSTGGPGAGIASGAVLGGMDWTFGMPIRGAIGLTHDVRHPVAAATHPLRVGQHLAEAGMPLDELPLMLSRALGIGRVGARVGQYIHRGPEHTKEWTVHRGPGGQPVFRDAEGNVVSGPMPESPSHIRYKTERTGGTSYGPARLDKERYWRKVFDAYSRQKLLGDAIWEYPNMNLTEAEVTALERKHGLGRQELFDRAGVKPDYYDNQGRPVYVGGPGLRLHEMQQRARDEAAAQHGLGIVSGNTGTGFYRPKAGRWGMGVPREWPPNVLEFARYYGTTPERILAIMAGKEPGIRLPSVPGR
jgi:hypothetical protein